MKCCILAKFRRRLVEETARAHHHPLQNTTSSSAQCTSFASQIRRMTRCGRKSIHKFLLNLWICVIETEHALRSGSDVCMHIYLHGLQHKTLLYFDNRNYCKEKRLAKNKILDVDMRWDIKCWYEVRCQMLIWGEISNHAGAPSVNAKSQVTKRFSALRLHHKTSASIKRQGFITSHQETRRLQAVLQDISSRTLVQIPPRNMKQVTKLLKIYHWNCFSRHLFQKSCTDSISLASFLTATHDSITKPTYQYIPGLITHIKVLPDT